MSFTRKTLSLPRSSVHLHSRRTCDRCGELKTPEGGVQMSPQKWYCVDCWTRRAVARRLK